MSRPLQKVLQALQQSDSSPTMRAAGQWMARCPAHDDRKPSLSVAEGDEGRVLLHCHAGCATKDVVAALHLTMGDLMPERNPSGMAANGRPAGRGQAAGAGLGDPLQRIAQQKGVSPESLAVYGARAVGPETIELPAYDPRGEQCTTFCLNIGGRKGRFASGKPAGLFFPHEGGRVRLPRRGETWHLVEGAKDAAALHAMGLFACGMNTCQLAPKFARLFASVDVVLIPDRDRAGEKGAARSARALQDTAASIAVATLPAEFQERGGADVRDVLRQKDGEKLVRRAIAEARVLQPAVPASGRLASGDRSGHESHATVAIHMADEWQLWHTAAGQTYATVPVDGHEETWAIGTKEFKRYLAKRFFDDQHKTIGREALSAAIDQLDAVARFDGPEHEAHIRVAGLDGAIYLDLCNPRWQAVKITPGGWQVVDNPPVRFRRSHAMRPLPPPQRGGRVDELRQFLNVDDNTWRLVVAWLLAALRPQGPYPLLVLCAEQGSGKSTAARLIRDLIDPNAAPLRSEPRSDHDLMVSAQNTWCLAFDNLSHVPAWLSDALCRLSTGGGFSTRALYTDAEEVILQAQRPVLLTSIDEVVTRSDLLDRSLICRLPTIPERQRRREADLINAFTEAHGRLLGALLDAVAGALRVLPAVELPVLPRMADFAYWATAVEVAVGWPKGAFLSAYQDNRNSAHALALEASPIGAPLLAFLQKRGPWCGTATELLEDLTADVPEGFQRQKGWPKNGQSLSRCLARLTPNLRNAGFEIVRERSGRHRVIRIDRVEHLRQGGSHTTQGATHRADDPGALATQGDASGGADCVYDACDASDAFSARPDMAEAGTVSRSFNRGNIEEESQWTF